MHFVHLELQIQLPSLPQYVAATVMGFMATFHGTYLLFPAACFYVSFRGTGIILKCCGFFPCVHHVLSSLFYIQLFPLLQYTMFINLFKDFVC